MDCNFIYNCAAELDWKSIIQSIEYLPGAPITPDRNKLTGVDYQNLFQLWDSCNFNYNSAKWINYYAKDYGNDVEKIFERIVKAKHVRSWISRIDPGYCAPWHWDIDNNENEYLKLGKLRRFTCFIGNSHPGHVSIINNTCMHLEKEGNIYEWSNYREWHAGVNAGTISKFQYNYLGYDYSSAS